MSSEAERVVRNAIELMSGASASVDEVMLELEPLLGPDAEWVNPADAVERGTRRGLEGWRNALENLRTGAGVGWRIEIKDLFQRGDQVFVRGFFHRGETASGVEVDGPLLALTYTVRDGRIQRFEYEAERDLKEFDGSKQWPPNQRGH